MLSRGVPSGWGARASAVITAPQMSLTGDDHSISLPGSQALLSLCPLCLISGDNGDTEVQMWKTAQPTKAQTPSLCPACSCLPASSICQASLPHRDMGYLITMKH